MENFFCRRINLLFIVIIFLCGILPGIVFSEVMQLGHNNSSFSIGSSVEDSSAETISPADMLLAIRSTEDGKLAFRESLQVMGGDLMDDEAIDHVMKQLDEMESGTPEGEEKKKEFNELFANYEKMFNDEVQKEEAFEKELDAHIDLEDELRIEEANTKTPELKDETLAQNWLDVLSNCKTPLSRKDKQLFRLGLSEFEAVVKAMRAPYDRFDLFNSISDLKLQANLLVINLNCFRRPLQMRYLFATDDDSKNVRSGLVLAVKYIDEIARQLAQSNRISSPQETIAFLKGWENCAKSRASINIGNNNGCSGDKKINDSDNNYSKKKSKNKRIKIDGAALAVDIKVQETRVCNDQLLSIIKNPRLIAEEAIKKKMRYIPPLLAKKHSQVHDNYQDRLSRASSDNYNPYYGRSGGSDNYRGNYSSPYYNLDKPKEQNISKTTSDKISDKKVNNGCVGGLPEKMSEELIALINTKAYKDLVALDRHLENLNSDTIKILSLAFLTLELQELPSKIKSALQDKSTENTNADGSEQDGTLKSNIKRNNNLMNKNAVKAALHKIYRPVYYLYSNVRKLPIMPGSLAKKETPEQDCAILVLPSRRLLDTNGGALQKSFDVFMINPCIDSFTLLQNTLSHQNITIVEKAKVLAELLSISELEPIELQEVLPAATKSTRIDRSSARNAKPKLLLSNKNALGEQIRKSWSTFNEQEELQAAKDFANILATLRGQVITNPLVRNNDFNISLSSCMSKLVSILYDYPASKKPFEYLEIKSKVSAFFNDFAEIYEKTLFQYFKDPLSQDVFATHKLLGNFANFTKALGFSPSNIFVDDAEAVDSTRKIIRSVVLLHTIFSDQNVTSSESQKIADLQLKKTDGWDKIFKNFKILLNFADYKEVFTPVQRRNLWVNTPQVTRRAIPLPYLTWCCGDAEKLDVVIFDLYNDLCDHIARLQKVERPLGLKSSFELVVANLTGLLGDLTSEARDYRGRNLVDSKERVAIFNFIVKILKKILMYNSASPDAIRETRLSVPTEDKNDVPNSSLIYNKLSNALDILYQYNVNTGVINNNAFDAKNYLAEFFALSHLPFSRESLIGHDKELYKNCIISIEESSGESNIVNASIVLLKKGFVWFWLSSIVGANNVSQASDIGSKKSRQSVSIPNNILNNIRTDEVGSKAKISNKEPLCLNPASRPFAALYRSPEVAKEETMPLEYYNSTPLSLLMAPYATKLLSKLNLIALENVWFVCTTLDALGEALLKTGIDKIHQDKFAKIVDSVMNNADITSMNIAVVIDQVMTEFVNYLQIMLNLGAINQKEKGLYENVLAIIIKIKTELNGYSDGSGIKSNLLDKQEAVPQNE